MGRDRDSGGGAGMKDDRMRELYIVDRERLNSAFLAVVVAAHEVGVADGKAEAAREHLAAMKRDFYQALDGGQRFSSEVAKRTCANCKFLIQETRVCQHGWQERQDIGLVCSLWEQIGLECQVCEHWRRNEGGGVMGFCKVLKKETREERLCELFARKQTGESEKSGRVGS